MRTRLLVTALLLAVLLVPEVAPAYTYYSFGTLRAPALAAPPCGYGTPYGAGYAPPAYYPPPYPYAYPTYAVPVVPYGYPLGYRGAWRTDYPWWSPGPRGYRWR